MGFAGIGCAIGSIYSTRMGLSAALATLAAVSLGFGYAQLRAEWVAAPVLSHKIGPAGLNGRIETAQVHGKGVRVVLGAVVSRRLKGETPARTRFDPRGQRHSRSRNLDSFDRHADAASRTGCAGRL